MRSNRSGCLTGLISTFSRIMLLAVWFARPTMMNSAFSTFIFPCLGFLFLPFTTLMYVILVQGANTIQGLDWLWLGLAVLLDIASIAGAGVANRDRIPAGVPGSYQGQTAAPPPAPAAAPIAAAAPVVPAAPAAPPESKPADTQNTQS
ncbi:MAG: hypothetical protein U0X20_16475 [Caldilineaceae bacterium]